MSSNWIVWFDDAVLKWWCLLFQLSRDFLAYAAEPIRIAQNILKTKFVSASLVSIILQIVLSWSRIVIGEIILNTPEKEVIHSNAGIVPNQIEQ